MNLENSKARLLEPDIKAIALNHLRSSGRIAPDSSIVNEFTVNNYTRRTDLAIVDKRKLIAIEVKSEADNLSRLCDQTNEYLNYFDKVIIIVASKHALKALENTPSHVAVWEVVDAKLKVRRRGNTIPIREKKRFIELMTANEMLKLVSKLRLSPPDRDKLTLEATLQEVSLLALKSAALQNIRDRYEASSSMFWKKTVQRQILPSDIELLSPYRSERKAEEAARQGRESFLKNWGNSQGDDPYLLKASQMEEEMLFGEIPQKIQELLSD